MRLPVQIAIIILILKSISFSQSDWHLVDESATRLPDTLTLSFDVDGGPIRPGLGLDLLVGQMPIITRNLPGVAQFFLNNGQGYFSLADSSFFPQRNDYTSVVMLFDIQGDGDLDAFIANFNYMRDYVAINDGNGIFHIDWSRLPRDSANALKGDYADVDDDGSIDVCLLGNNEMRFSDRMWMNNGQGYFHNEIDRLPAPRSYYRYVGFADLNGDLAPDIVAVYDDGYESHPEIFINDGSGHFSNESAQRLPPSENFCWIAALADIDNDGDYDILLSYATRIGFLINDSTGHFTDQTDERGPADGGASAFGVFDANDDGHEDFIFGTSGDSSLIFVNDGTGHFEDQTSLRLPVTYSSTRKIFAGDLDGDGDADLFRVGDAYCRNSIYINTLNARDSIPPSIMNQIILPIFDTLTGPYPVKMITQDGVSIEYQLSCYVHYSINRITFYSDSLHYTGGFIFYGTIPEVDSGITVYYYYTATDKEGNESRIPRNAPDSLFSFTYLPGYVGINESNGQLPEILNISAYPNPFNSSTILSIGSGRDADISIYDITGRLVSVLHSQDGKATWKPEGYSSGIYFARAGFGDKSSVIKLIYLK